MTNLNDLAARCESGSGADRELDAVIWCAVEHPDRRPEKDFFYTAREEWGYFTTNQPLPGMTFHDAPHLTDSLDAAVSFVERALPGWGWYMATGGGVTEAGVHNAQKQEWQGVNNLPARALVAAALRSRSQESGA
ncbi:hypothetical protein [EBPR siphovirus 2]|nr:hypothetical protein [EBPR siphovirus 2]